MSEELDDAKEFASAVENSEGKRANNRRDQSKAVAPSHGMSEREEKPTPGQVSQYALYGEGYTATTPTVKSLPPGSYDIRADQKCVFAVPALKRAGLLLELPEMRSDAVVKLAETFWESEKDYKEGNEFVIGGARYSAGLLLFGPPGSGKSCTIQIVSNKLIERGGTVFFASIHPMRVIDFLTDFSRVERNRKCIVILEDIDSLIADHGESAYLEMLDSAKTIDNVFFIATTNYPELLDPRVYNRPGRMSNMIRIGMPGKKAREAYLKAILKNHRDVDKIVENSENFTIDHLTALVNSVYREKKNLDSELERLRTLFKVPKATEKPAMGIGGKNWEPKDE